MKNKFTSIIFIMLAFIVPMILESSETKDAENMCTSFFNSLFEKTSTKEMTVYCNSVRKHGDWITGSGYNYARSQTIFIATRISSDYWLIMLNDPNASLDLWLFSNKILEQVTYGFTIDSRRVPIYSQDEVSDTFLKAIADSRNIVLGFRFSKYHISSKGSGAAIRYLIQGEPGKSRWKTGLMYSPQ